MKTRAARADDFADAALHDLLFCDQVAVLVTPAITNAHVDARFLDRFDDAVGVGEREREWLFNEDVLAELDRLQQRLDVLAFAGRDDDCVDFGARDDVVVVAAVELRLDLRCEIGGFRVVLIGDRDVTHRGMSRSKPRAQRADAAGADDRQSYGFACHFSINMNIRFLHHFRPLRDFDFHELRQLLRRAADGLDRRS